MKLSLCQLIQLIRILRQPNSKFWMKIDMDGALPEAEAGAASDAGPGEISELSDMIVDESIGDAGNRNSELLFVKWVLSKASEGVNDAQLLVAAAVHAVFLEFGFVCLDSVPMAIGDSNLLDESPYSSLAISQSYTLPEILADGSISTNKVVLRFQRVGICVNVDASLSDAGSVIRTLSLDQSKFAPARELMKLMLVKCDMNDAKINKDDDVFKLWKMVKDGLAFALLIDLRERAGLSAPPWFMSVGEDVQRRIIECLPGVDVAKVGSVCSELRHLCSDNELWKLKFEEKFGLGESEGAGGTNSYKDLFAKYWSMKKTLGGAVAVGASGSRIRRRQYSTPRANLESLFVTI